MPIFDDPRLMGGTANLMQPMMPAVKKKPQPPIGYPPPAPMLTGEPEASGRAGAPGNNAWTGVTPPPSMGSTVKTFGDNPSGPPAPPPGLARAWSSVGPATSSTPIQEFHVPIGPVSHPGEYQPAPIGRASSGFGDQGAGGGGATAADSISRFYDSIGLPLSSVISGAQRDEALARHMATQRFGSEQGTVGLQQAMMQHNLTAAPQNEIARRISELSTANLYNPTPQGAALIKQYIQQLQGMGGGGVGPVAGSGEQQEASTPAATPTQAPVTNNHPGVGGMIHSALHGALPALAGGGGWAAGAALAPETGFASLAVPAIASALGYFGGNKLMNVADPSGVEAAAEHPIANIGGQLAGGLAGYRGFGALGSSGAKATGGPAGTLAAELAGTPTTQNMAARANQAKFSGRNIRQMSPFGGGEVNPGETPIAPRSRQLTMGELATEGAEPRTTVTSANTPTQEPGQLAPFAPPKVQMSGDPQIEAALAAFKASGQATPSNILPFPQQQQTQPAPGMQSTVIPSANATQAPIATNPVQMPQPPSAVTTLNPSLMNPQMLQRLIGDPRIGPAIIHDPSLQALIAKYLRQPAP